jgi:hypothetical protein
MMGHVPFVYSLLSFSLTHSLSISLSHSLSFSLFLSLSLSLSLPFLHALSSHSISYIETSVSDIEEAFKSFTTRTDINVLLINQHVSLRIMRINSIVTQGCFIILLLYPSSPPPCSQGLGSSMYNNT